jgi:hypothetical protein
MARYDDSFRRVDRPDRYPRDYAPGYGRIRYAGESYRRGRGDYPVNFGADSYPSRPGRARQGDRHTAYRGVNISPGRRGEYSIEFQGYSAAYDRLYEGPPAGRREGPFRRLWRGTRSLLRPLREERGHYGAEYHGRVGYPGEYRRYTGYGGEYRRRTGYGRNYR